MPRPPQVQEQILEYLAERAEKGCTRAEFNVRFGSSAYPYQILCQLGRVEKVSKINDRWYIGAPKHWLAEVDVSSFIHMQTPRIKALRSPVFTTGSKFKMEELERDAELGLAIYILWCQVNRKPFPVYKFEMTEDERVEARSRILELFNTYGVPNES